MIHRIEGIKPGMKRPDPNDFWSKRIVITFSDRPRYKIPDKEMYRFNFLQEPGDVCFNYCHVGKPLFDVFDNEAAKLKDEINFLAQGTIYPDVIESSESESKEARVIKSHHNVGGLPDDMQMELVEPLRDLFKDEVRKMGSELGLPLEMLNRHPFPGPGLGVRILGEISQEKVLILQNADAILIEELIKAGLYNQVSQAFCAFLPIKSVGVVGDERRYADVIAIRAVETVDFMTATWARLPYDFLAHVSNRIVNELEGVSRVVYDISSKPPATIEWE